MSNEEEKKEQFKVGDRVVLSYLQEMEPGIIRKITGDKATIDIGADKLYLEDTKDLIKIQDTADIEYSDLTPKEDNAGPTIIESLEKTSNIQDGLLSVMASVDFKNEYKTGTNNLGELEASDLAFEDAKIGNKVRRIGTKRVGTLIKIDHSSNTYRVRWDDNLITSNWKQELTRQVE